MLSLLALLRSLLPFPNRIGKCTRAMKRPRRACIRQLWLAAAGVVFLGNPGTSQAGFVLGVDVGNNIILY
jgi:hypothetical protein